MTALIRKQPEHGEGHAGDDAEGEQVEEVHGDGRPAEDRQPAQHQPVQVVDALGQVAGVLSVRVAEVGVRQVGAVLVEPLDLHEVEGRVTVVVVGHRQRCAPEAQDEDGGEHRNDADDDAREHEPRRRAREVAAPGDSSPGAGSATGTIPCSMPAAASPELDALSATTCVVTGGLGFIGSNMVHALASAGAHVRVVDALVPEHGGDRRNLEGLEHPERVEVLDRRYRRPGRRRGRRRRRRRVQRRRAGQPPGEHDGPAARPRPQRAQPARLPRDAAARRAPGPRRAHVDPPGVRPARAAARSTRRTRRARSTSTASTSWPASSSTCCTAACTACGDRAAAHQRLRRDGSASPVDDLGLLAGVRPPGARGRARSSCTATARSGATACTSTTSSARSPSRRRPMRRSARSSTSGTPPARRCARSPRPSCGWRTARAGCELVPWPEDLARIDIGDFQGDYAQAARAARLEAGHRPRRRRGADRSPSTADTRGTCRRPEPPGRPAGR